MGAELRLRLNRAIVAELAVLRLDRLPDRLPRNMQPPRDLPHRLPLHEIRTPDPSSGNQHQRVDFKPLQPKIVDRFPQRIKAAEEIGTDIESSRQPARRGGYQLLYSKARQQQRSANQREDQLAVRAEDAAMSMIVIFMVFGRSRCRRRDTRGHSHVRERIADRPFRTAFTIELDPHQTRSVRFRLDHARQTA